jgi:ribosomal protein S18 acetylase RimI-like enzyme
LSRRIDPAPAPASPEIWRQAQSTDLKAIGRIADEVHPGLPESPAVFAEKLQLFPQGCFVLAPHGHVTGYGISYPWMLDHIPSLDKLLGALPALPKCLFVHDVAIVPEARGRGSAGILMGILTHLAREHHLPCLALVSVYGTDALWSRHGFTVQPGSRFFEKLEPYGPSARYMTATVIP